MNKKMDRVFKKGKSLFALFWAWMKRLPIYAAFLCLMLLIGLFSQSDLLRQVLTLWLADIGLGYCMASWVVTNKYKLGQEARLLGKIFDDSSYESYWSLSQMRMNLMLRLVLFSFFMMSQLLPLEKIGEITSLSYLDVTIIGLIQFVVAFLVGLVLSLIIISSVPQHEVIEELHEISQSNFISETNHKEDKNEKLV